jgi:hypothetical protein
MFDVFIINVSVMTHIIHRVFQIPLIFFEGFPARRGNTHTTFGGAMKHRQKLKKQIMKTRILLTTLGAAALAAITLNVNAGETLLAPRAAGNQIKAVPGITTAQPASAAQSVSPRALGSQTLTVASVANDVNPAMECTKMIASPKAIQACAANPAAMSGCCKTAMVDGTAH